MKTSTAKSFVRSAINAMVHYNVDTPIGKRLVLAMTGVMYEYHATVADMVTPEIAIRIARLSSDSEYRAMIREALTTGGAKVNAKTQLWRKAGSLHRPKVEGIMKDSVVKASQAVLNAVVEKAAAYAKDNAARLVADISTTDMNRIARIVERGIKSNAVTNDIAKDILDAVNDDQFTDQRSQAVAVTEVNNAMAYGAHEAYRESGATMKSWYSVEGACEICSENAAAGVIPILAEFPSGHDYPTAHPWCRCFCVYYGAKGNETEESSGGETPWLNGLRATDGVIRPLHTLTRLISETHQHGRCDCGTRRG